MTSKKVDFEDLVGELEFSPTAPMQEAKAAFWAVAVDSPMVDPQDLTLAAVQQLCPDTRIKRWWSVPGFVEWFCNRNEWRQRVEYLVNRGLNTIEDILNDPDAAPSARVKAFEVLARLASKEPARVKEVRWADSQLNDMTKEQLEAFLAKSGYLPAQRESGTDGSEEEQE